MTEYDRLTPAEVRELRDLLKIEKVRKTMVLYSHLMDSRDWSGMARLYTEDAVCEWGPYGHFEGRGTIHARLVEAHPGRVAYDGFHITTNVWVELTGEDQAFSRTYLTDMWPAEELGPISHPAYPEDPVLLYGIYENEHRRVGDEWLISRSQLEFVWPKRIMHEGFPRTMAPQFQPEELAQ